MVIYQYNLQTSLKVWMFVKTKQNHSTSHPCSKVTLTLHFGLPSLLSALSFHRSSAENTFIFAFQVKLFKTDLRPKTAVQGYIPCISSSCRRMYSTMRLAICLYSSYDIFSPFLGCVGAEAASPVCVAGCSAGVPSVIKF